MRINLRVGEGYALSKHKLSQFNIRYISLLAVLMSMCLYAVMQVSAQVAEPAATAVTEITPLQIGDTIPEALWHLPLQVVNHPEGKDTITLANFRDKKLIILDFWATWCAPCISSLHKLDSIQMEFREDAAILPSSYEEREKVGSFIENQGWSLCSAISETTLKTYFPHRSIPHQVWISNGVVSGVTRAADITRENISKMIKDDKFCLRTKNDILDFQPTTNLGVFAERAGAKIHASSSLTNYIEGIPSSMGRRVSENLQYVYYTNVAITQMYQRALGIEHNQLMIVSDNVDDYVYSGNKQHLYAYQLVLPKYVPQADVAKRILQDLNTCFKSKVDTQTVLKDCFVISRSSKDAKTKGKTRLQDSVSNRPDTYKLSTFIELLNFNPSWSPNLPRFIDESGYVGLINRIPYRDLQHDLDKLVEFLRPYGLIVTKEKRPLKMYILSDKTRNGFASYHKP